MNNSIVLSISLSDEDINSIMSSALNNGVCHWCSDIVVKEDTESEDYTQSLIEGKTLILTTHYDSEHILNKEKLLEGISLYLTSGMENILISNGNEVSIDLSRIDSFMSDTFIQLGIFGKEIYV